MGRLYIPSELVSGLNVTLNVSLGVQPGNQLASAVLDITLIDSQGSFISQLNAPLIICLPKPLNVKKGESVCLSYYNEKKGEWLCEDECITSQNDLFCGETDHLTNFALLLSGGKPDEGDPCHPQSQNRTMAWLSLGFVAGAVLIVALSVVVIEIFVRIKKNRLNRDLQKLAQRAADQTVF